MTWRPDDWDKIRANLLLRDKPPDLIEAGADAILEALKKEGTYWRDRYDDPLLKVRKGCMVIIPDEEVRMDTSETYIKMCQKAFPEDAELENCLKTQDQLQEMVCKDWGLQTICTRIEKFSKASDGGVSITIGGSMEQLWLAFVMKGKYSKVWDGENWVKPP